MTTAIIEGDVTLRSGGTEVGTASDPLRVDPTGETTQPVSGTVDLGTIADVATETTLALIKNTDGIKKIVDPLPAGTNNIGDVDIASALPAGTNNIGDVDIASSLPAGSNEIGKVAQGTKGAAGNAWPQVLYDASGNAVGVVLDGAVYRLQTQAKIVRASDGAQINPATQETLAAIKDTDGIKKIVDALPAGTNNIGDVDVLSSALPSGAATSAAQTDGTQKAIVRGGAKGTTIAGDVTSVSVSTDVQALHVKVVGGGGGSSVDSNVNIVDSLGNNIATADGSTPAANRALMVEGYDATNTAARRLAVDALGRMIIAPSGSVSSQAGFAFGEVNLAATTSAPVNKTAYTEQTTNAQRSIASASANDTAAGTGARQVKITYLDQTGAGPYTETVTLNGTSYVNTTAVNICYIERMEVVSVGSGGSNAGIITLKAATAGGGATIGTITAADNRTFWTHHYVPTGKTCYVTSLSCSSNSSVAGNGSIATLRAHALGSNLLVQISDFVWVYGQSSNVARNYGTPINVTGPAHVEGWVTTTASNNIFYRQSFDYYDQ